MGVPPPAIVRRQTDTAESVPLGALVMPPSLTDKATGRMLFNVSVPCASLGYVFSDGIQLAGQREAAGLRQDADCRVVCHRDRLIV